MRRFGRYQQQKADPHDGHIANERIRDRELRVITESGENIGVVSKEDALARAQEAGLDLVQISKSGDGPPVVKIMDFGKFLYEKKKKQHEAKKHQKIVQIKEIKLRPSIGDQDYRIKLNRAIKFLQEGKKVKFTIQFRGRQMIMMNELGSGLFGRIATDLREAELGALVEEKESRGRPFWSKVVAIKTK